MNTSATVLVDPHTRWLPGAFRSTALGALFLAAGCAASGSIEPPARPPDVRIVRPPAVTHRTEIEATDEGFATTTQSPPSPDAEPPRRTTATPAPAASSAAKTDPFGDVGFKEVNEKEWLAGIRDNIVQREKIAPSDLCFSPGLLRAAFVRSSPVAAPVRRARRAPPRHHEIVVVDNQGRRVASFRPLVSHGSDEPPRDLRFLSDERLVYEVIVEAPAIELLAPKKAPSTKTKDGLPVRAKNVRPKAKPNAPPRAKAAAKPTRDMTGAAPTAVPSVPQRLFVIQPLAPRARAIRCQGFDFTFAPKHDRLAFVGGQIGTAFVTVDGAQVYPRHGRTIVASAPVWSKDGQSLAFLEQPAGHPARLVLVAALDNQTGDATWDLPADAKIDGASVIWAGTGKLIVRKTAMRPIFSASFVMER